MMAYSSRRTSTSITVTGTYTEPYSNVQPFKDFRQSLAEHFKIQRFFPTSYYWNHWEPSRKLIRAANMRININIPIIAPVLGVQYILICSAREPADARSHL